jgi:hypothetical protein
MPVHEMLLESADKNIRIAAGENIGLMFETANIFLAANVSHLPFSSSICLFYFIFLKKK